MTYFQQFQAILSSSTDSKLPSLDCLLLQETLEVAGQTSSSYLASLDSLICLSFVVCSNNAYWLVEKLSIDVCWHMKFEHDSQWTGLLIITSDPPDHELESDMIIDRMNA